MINISISISISIDERPLVINIFFIGIITFLLLFLVELVVGFSLFCVIIISLLSFKAFDRSVSGSHISTLMSASTQVTHISQNKLAKLGDAIAISKSETINHSLTY